MVDFKFDGVTSIGFITLFLHSDSITASDEPVFTTLRGVAAKDRSFENAFKKFDTPIADKVPLPVVCCMNERSPLKTLDGA